jgi:hypothetical protein
MDSNAEHALQNILDLKGHVERVDRVSRQQSADHAFDIRRCAQIVRQ